MHVGEVRRWRQARVSGRLLGFLFGFRFGPGGRLGQTRVLVWVSVG